MSSRISDVSLSAVTAGFVAVLVGFTSSVAIVFQAAQSLGATPAEAASWMWALGWGMGLATLLPSLWLRKPVMVAWSTPGAAVLAVAGASGGFGMAEATGAFIACAALIFVAGASGAFERVMTRIPMPLAGALLAGVLARFGLDAFAALQSSLGLVLSMLAAYLLGRRWWPRYAVVGVLAIGTLVAALAGQLRPVAWQWEFTRPVFTAPVFTWRAIVSLAIPLFIVTMASQNLPGVAAIRDAGYRLPISKLIALTGVATLILAPFGAFALNLAAITAAICMGREAHADPARRWVAAAACGALYCVVGVFGAAVATLLAAFPRELVVAVAGLALLGTIGSGLASALKDDGYREAALVTFLVTLSGVSLAGIGSAFWGVVAGAVGALCATVATPLRRLALPLPMKFLFVADPLESFNIKKDSTFAMMREAARRGHALFACEAKDLLWERGAKVVTHVRQITLTGEKPAWFSESTPAAGAARARVALADFDAVLMRKDPPFDSEYFYATHLLEQAERDGARVFNRPAALRDHPEKLAILEFPQFISPTIVTRDAAELKRFHAEHHDVILKPLDGMGGTGIFRIAADGMNLGVAVETLNARGAHTVMAQRYLPAIVQGGDKRILVIAGVPVPFVLARIPQGNEIRGNLAAGGIGVAQPISARDREIAEHIGPILAARGLLLIGLDVIGDSLTEINVTSPTCFQEITDQAGFDVAKVFIDALEAALV